MLPIIRPHRLVRIDPTDSCNHYSRLWDNYFNDAAPKPHTQSLGNLDLYEDDQNLNIEVELPGFKRDQFEITLEENILNLAAERIIESEESKDTYYLMERRQGKWSRSLKLPV
ncbi:MAG: Hsp20/alpha crystallin family protein, partial [Planctomycetes bacterium]|nr:Hsp20/alpha crystallin family protein [Planctomycetota bacterium]